MKSFSLFIILSLAFSHNLQAVPIEKTIIDPKEQSPQEFPNEEAFENLSITTPPSIKNLPKPKKPYLFLYDSSFSLFLSSLYLLDAEESKFSFGFLFSDYKDVETAWEYGFDIFEDEAKFEFGQKFLMDSEGIFRLHSGWILGLVVDADKGLANLVNFRELLLGGMLGTEYVFSDPYSLRNDFRFFFGRDEIILQLSLNFVYSW